ncbi:MAG: hypothetical protein M1828_006153 [Chrysothrix sp. TS-e1954]|nr:MAG: hypothetical protein M1828_006153 [Chrysothrix sp. TS-e1954]
MSEGPKQRLRGRQRERSPLQVQTTFLNSAGISPKQASSSARVKFHTPLSYGKRSETQGKPIPAPLKLRQELSPNDGLISILLSIPTTSSTKTDSVSSRSRRPRAASSLYSKANTPATKSKARQSPPPPLPQSRNTEHEISEAGRPETRKRGLSDCTIATTSSTPRRSKGWWNVVTSPFLSRSLSSAHSKKSFEASCTPSLPNIPDLYETVEPKEGTGNFLDYFYWIPTTGLAAAYYDEYYNDQKHLSGFFALYDDDKTQGIKEWPHRIDSEDPTRDETPDGHNSPPNATEVHDAEVLCATDGAKDLGTPADTRDIAANHNSPETIGAATSHPNTSHPSVASPETPFSANTPVLGTAYIRRFESAHSVDATKPTVLSSPVLKPKTVNARQNVQQKHGSARAMSQYALLDEHDLPRPSPIHEVQKDAASRSKPISPVPSSGAQDAPPSKSAQSKARFTDEKPPHSIEKSREGCTASVYRTQEASRRYELAPKQYPKEARTRQSGTSKLLKVAVVIVTALVLLSLILAMTISQSISDEPVQLNWTSVADLPPIQTGIGTILPKTMSEQSQCVGTKGLWSCNAPSDEQTSLLGGLPQFRIEIRYDQDKTMPKVLPPGTFNNTIRHVSRHVRSTDTQLKGRSFLETMLTTAQPPPPSLQDQAFIGNTTDTLTPIEGEATGFSMTFLPSQEVKSHTAARLARRDNATTTRTIPKAPVEAPIFYPLPSAQPLKLYNRDHVDEHYGFYSYFDRSQYVKKSNASALSGATAVYVNASDDANALCIFSQTRFLVQIWTKHKLSSPQSNSTSSANDFNTPGSLQLSTTITLDRHGGDASKKGVYCYSLDANKHPLASAKWLVPEDRASGGRIVNPAPGPFQSVQSSSDQQWHYGGSDGGSGGCRCAWGT